MSRYRESNLTDKGLDLARKAANGVIKITFTKGVLSADAHQNDSLQTIEGLTTLSSFAQSDPINYVTPSDDANVNVPLRFHNTSMTADAYINTVGLYATDGTTEVLYSVIINDDPELFPAYNGTTPESIKINHTTQVGRADQVSVQVSPLGTVTEEEFNAKSFQYVDTWTKGIWDLQTSDHKDGMYYIPNNNIDNITDWNNQNSVVIKYSTPEGCVLQLIDSVGNVWIIDNFSGTFSKWNRLANASDVNAGLSAANSNAQSLANAASSAASSMFSSASQQESNDVGSINSALGSKVSFSSGAITTGNGTFVPAATNDITSTIKNTISNGDNFDNYLHNGTYPINNVNFRTIGGSGGLPSLTSFTGDLTVIVKGNEIVQLISGNNNVQFFRIQGQFWAQLASQADVTNLQNQINANNSSISAIQNSVGNNATGITTLNNGALQYRGEWTEQGLWSISSQLDGWYYVRTNHQDSITGWNSLNSQLFKTSMPSGCMLRLYDSWGHIWYTNNFNGSFFTWKQLA